MLSSICCLKCLKIGEKRTLKLVLLSESAPIKELGNLLSPTARNGLLQLFSSNLVFLACSALYRWYTAPPNPVENTLMPC